MILDEEGAVTSSASNTTGVLAKSSITVGLNLKKQKQ